VLFLGLQIVAQVSEITKVTKIKHKNLQKRMCNKHIRKLTHYTRPRTNDERTHARTHAHGHKKIPPSPRENSLDRIARRGREQLGDRVTFRGVRLRRTLFLLSGTSPRRP
jgi:hypothetical protein